MEKEEIIKLRNTLKTTGNLPLRIYPDNGLTVIDESLKTQFTIWDDNNGILYSFRLIGMQEDSAPNNNEKCIDCIAFSYEWIQAMEIVRLPLDKIEGTIDGIISSGATVSDNFKKTIIQVFEELLNFNQGSLTPTLLNEILLRNNPDMPKPVSDNDDYLNGKFTQSWQETHLINEYNKTIDGENK
jgi:hypothetical protein